MLVEASILIDAPRDEVFALLTEYGSEARLRISPNLRQQKVIEHQGNVVVCENTWEQKGRSIRQTRRYVLFPPDRIEEEVVGATKGMLRVTTRLEAEGDQTQLTLISEYRLAGLWRLLEGTAAKTMQDSDEQLLERLKERIEAEFEEVEEG